VESVIPHLFVGGDTDYLKVKEKDNWSVLRCAKYGPGGHQDTLGYATLGAPKGPQYLSVDQRGRRALNFIDVQDPNLIPIQMIEKGLEFIDKRLSAGDNVLVACNQGQSRGPITALLYLRAIGDLTGNFIQSEKIFRTLYRHYDPGIGARAFARSNWDTFDRLLRKGNNG
jgi:hypothetical protein